MASGGAAIAVILLWLVVSLAFFIPNLAVTVRRLHDTDRSGWWIMLYWGPYLASLFMTPAITGTAMNGGNIETMMGVSLAFSGAQTIGALVLLVFLFLDGTPGHEPLRPRSEGQGGCRRTSSPERQRGCGGARRALDDGRACPCGGIGRRARTQNRVPQGVPVRLGPGAPHFPKRAPLRHGRVMAETGDREDTEHAHPARRRDRDGARGGCLSPRSAARRSGADVRHRARPRSAVRACAPGRSSSCRSRPLW